MAKESGYLITQDDSGETVVGTHQCCHCGGHWAPRPGSGIRRGFCLRCNKLTCGKPGCDPCVPVEQLLDNIEKGRALDYRPIVATSGWQPLTGTPLTLCSTG
jgi:hypothetical protein